MQLWSVQYKEIQISLESLQKLLPAVVLLKEIHSVEDSQYLDGVLYL